VRPEAVSEIVVEITGLAPGGEAVGRQVGGAHDGRVTFVAFAAPGERVRARLSRERGRVAWADLVAVERPSPLRVEPPCPLFRRCGGCQWQHVPRDTQLEAKRAIVERALRSPVERIEAVGPDYGYRDRARLVVGEGSEDERPVGFRAWRSHEIVDVPACPLLGTAAAEALAPVRARARAQESGTEVALQAGRDGVAARIGARSFRHEGGADAGDGGELLVDVGEPGSPPLRIPPGAFAQVGAAANAALVRALLELVGPAPGRVLELYAGSGNFTRHLVGRAEVVATDADRAAVARGRAQVPGARWLDAPRAADVGAFDTVVADPPREGLDAANLPLALLAGRRLVYVSCDPQTLGRDVQRLGAAGLRLERAVALDLMPQTYHVEVVAAFVRSG
jgi:23S rRNA (uracil1939-C5)-methyltransferase